MIEVGYALDTIFFGIIAYLFKNTTILAGFFETAYPSALIDKENVDLFSRKLGFKHNQLVGRKILLEFDPASNYEKPIQDFVIEAIANAEPIAMFTRRGSAIHSVLSKRKGVMLLYLTQQVSVPTVGASENEILLPINNASLLLETLNNAMDANPHDNISIVFDNLSELVLSNGFKKTYNFIRYALEILSSSRVTALFLLNPNAHDPKVSSSLRGLFNNQVTYGKEGLQVIKLQKSS